MNIVTYLINLDDSKDRLDYASQQLQNAGIAFTRISAFDGRNVDTKMIEEYDAEKAVSYMGRQLTGGELGCYLSHFSCLHSFLDTDAQYAMVLEDDLVLEENIAETISKILTWLEEKDIPWYLLNISASKRKIYTTLTHISGKDLMNAHYFPMLATGLIWSRQGAQAFINEHQTIFAPVDNYFRWWLTKNNKGFSVWPPLVSTTGAQSDIDGHTFKRKNNGRSLKYGFAKQKRLWSDKLIALYHKYVNKI